MLEVSRRHACQLRKQLRKYPWLLREMRFADVLSIKAVSQ